MIYIINEVIKLQNIYYVTQLLKVGCLVVVYLSGFVSGSLRRLQYKFWTDVSDFWQVLASP